MNVAIIGSRDWPQPQRVRDFVEKLAARYPEATVVSGGARGVDTTAETAALKHGLEVCSYRVYEHDRGKFYVGIHLIDPKMPAPTVVTQKTRPFATIAEPTENGAQGFSSFAEAALHRNGLIVIAQQVVAFWDGRSRGTADAIEQARKRGLEPHIYKPEWNLL